MSSALIIRSGILMPMVLAFTCADEAPPKPSPVAARRSASRASRWGWLPEPEPRLSSASSRRSDVGVPAAPSWQPHLLHFMHPTAPPIDS